MRARKNACCATGRNISRLRWYPAIRNIRWRDRGTVERKSIVTLADLFGPVVLKSDGDLYSWNISICLRNGTESNDDLSRERKRERKGDHLKWNKRWRDSKNLDYEIPKTLNSWINIHKYASYVNMVRWRIVTFQFRIGNSLFALSHLRNYVPPERRFPGRIRCNMKLEGRGDVIKSNKHELRGINCIFYHIILGSFELITRDPGGRYRFPALKSIVRRSIVL